MVGQHGDHPLNRLGTGDAVAVDEQVIDAVVKRLRQQVGGERDRDPRVLQGDPDLVGEPDPDHVVHERSRRDAQRAGRGVVGRDHPRGHHVRARPESLGAQIGGNAGQVAEVDVDARSVDEGAAAASPAAVHGALVFKPVENLPHGRPAHPELHGELAFGGQPSQRHRVADVPGILDPGYGTSLPGHRASFPCLRTCLGMADAHSATIDGARPEPAGRCQPASIATTLPDWRGPCVSC